ncbi:hypothetical protein DL95DRAFT_510035 [Leptodontidium sp. 2 PMI_412]|nr:hypothetical protein DL95DRAFT_510035 [Leptodontidium sp. 2 PMI_412]
MFHKLKQKASLARVNIASDSNAEKDGTPRRKFKPGTFEPITEKSASVSQSSDIKITKDATEAHVSEAENYRIQLHRMVKWEQDALHRVKRAEARRDRAINQAELLAHQLERSTHQVEILQAGIGGKDGHIGLRNGPFDEVHAEELERLQQNIRDIQDQRDAELLEQRGCFMLQIMDVQKRRDEEFQNMRDLNQAQAEEIRTLKQSLRVEVMMRSKPLDCETMEPGHPVKESPSVGISGALIDGDSDQGQRNSLQEMGEEKDDVLRRLCLELDTLKQRTRDMEDVLSRSREEIEERQRAKEVLQTDLEEKTRALEERTLAWNRAKNELNEEKRNGRQISEDNMNKNRQLEFVQHQCARLKESLSLREN